MKDSQKYVVGHSSFVLSIAVAKAWSVHVEKVQEDWKENMKCFRMCNVQLYSVAI